MLKTSPNFSFLKLGRPSRARFWARQAAATLFAGAIAAAAPSASTVAGRYELRPSRPDWSELVLDADGGFRWHLVTERTDERATGRWRRRGDVVLLTTDPPAGAQELVREASYLNGEWALQVEVERDGFPIPGAAVEVGFAGGGIARGVTGPDGWRLSRRERRRPVWLRVVLPAGLAATRREPVFAREANSIRFQLEPVAAGTVNFRNEPVRRRGNALVMRRAGRELVYEQSGAPG